MKGKNYLSGTISTIILAQLKRSDRMYGYEICQKVKALTQSEIQLTEAAIYPSLHKLEKEGSIHSSKERVNGRIRKYYHLAPGNEALVDLQIEELIRFTKNLQILLNPSKT
jgi:PadR family transcriptional regulator PadR